MQKQAYQMPGSTKKILTISASLAGMAAALTLYPITSCGLAGTAIFILGLYLALKTSASSKTGYMARALVAGAAAAAATACLKEVINSLAHNLISGRFTMLLMALSALCTFIIAINLPSLTADQSYGVRQEQ